MKLSKFYRIKWNQNTEVKYLGKWYVVIVVSFVKPQVRIKDEDTTILDYIEIEAVRNNWWKGDGFIINVSRFIALLILALALTSIIHSLLF